MLKLLIYLAIGCLSSALLAGCGTQTPALPEYVERVASVLDQPVGSAPVALQVAPRGKALKTAIANSKINALQFAELHRCDMGDLVGQRNSGLGRLAQDSQRLSYEAQWLCRAQTCELDWFEEIRDNKLAQLPGQFWNATIAGDEFRSLLTANNPGDIDSDALLELSNVWQAIAELDTETCATIDGFSGRFESLLNRLRNQGSIQARRAQWAAYRVQLDTITSLLTDMRRPLCLSDKPTAKAQRLFAVFKRHYIESLQPKMSRELQTDRLWVDAVANLNVSLGAVAPEAWHDFYRNALDPSSASSEWSQTSEAIVRHAQAWQHIFDQCGTDIRSLVTA